MSDYSGWTNYQTWEAATLIQNDESLYNIALEFRTKGFKELLQFLKDNNDLSRFSAKKSLTWTSVVGSGFGFTSNEGLTTNSFFFLPIYLLLLLAKYRSKNSSPMIIFISKSS